MAILLVIFAQGNLIGLKKTIRSEALKRKYPVV